MVGGLRVALVDYAASDFRQKQHRTGIYTYAV
jgi:hypothetical protein